MESRAESKNKSPARSNNPVFWDRIALSYSKKPVKDEQAYAQTLDRVRSYLGIQHNILELGCGTGTTALLLAPSVAQLHATDISGNMIDIARQKALAEGVRHVTFAQGTLDDQRAQAGAYDAVLAFNLMHLFEDIPAAITTVHGLLKPGGLFISKTPCVGESSFLLRGLIPLLHLFGQAPFVNFIKKDPLREHYRAAGFEIIEEGLYPAKSHALFLVGRKAG